MNSTIKNSIIIFSVAIGLLITACNNKQNKSSNIENHHHLNTESVYACPMHPEETGKHGDKCSKCGMDLKLVRKDNTENIKVKITSTPKKIEVGNPTQLAFTITENDKNVAFDIVHEKKIHLLIVDETLTWFDHKHTEEQADGSHTVTETFPYSGKYFVFTDFKASGSPATVDKQEIEVTGNVTAKPDTTTSKWISKVDDYTVTLVNGNDFKTNRPQHFGLTIEKKGKFITATDIQQYLGAVAHVIVIDKADKNFLHVHPTSNEKFPIQGETRFEKAGVYRMWVQFKLEGKVHTADFTINVTDGDRVIESKSHNHNGHQH